MFKKKNTANAKMFIMQEMSLFEDLSDGRFHEAYIRGLLDMAFELGAIELNDRAYLSTMAHQKEQEIKSKGQPVYKKKGCYEYRGYYILKIHNMGDGAKNWSVKKTEGEEIIVEDDTFKEGIKRISRIDV